MQIMIDIPDNNYLKIQNFPEGVTDFRTTEMLYRAVRNGTPIPENPTNGNMIIALYPDLRYVIQNGRIVTTIGVASSFDEDWWNAPYKGGQDADSN